MMEVSNVERKTIWGSWWEPVRKWFYPVWLLYELTHSFGHYAVSSYKYIDNLSNHTIAVLGAVVAFMLCSAFLTLTSCFVLFHFFKTKNLTKTSFEEKVKWYH